MTVSYLLEIHKNILQPRSKDIELGMFDKKKNQNLRTIPLPKRTKKEKKRKKKHV